MLATRASMTNWSSVVPRVPARRFAASQNDGGGYRAGLTRSTLPFESSLSR